MHIRVCNNIRYQNTEWKKKISSPYGCAEGLPYGVVCIVGGPAPSHVIIGGADDKLKRKPSLHPSSQPVVFFLSLSLTRSCYSPDKPLRCITTYARHNENETRMLSSIHIVPDRILECTYTRQLNMYIIAAYIHYTYYIGTYAKCTKKVCWSLFDWKKLIKSPSGHVYTFQRYFF